MLVNGDTGDGRSIIRDDAHYCFVPLGACTNTLRDWRQRARASRSCDRHHITQLEWSATDNDGKMGDPYVFL